MGSSRKQVTREKAIIFVPGIMGSCLRHFNGQQSTRIWPLEPWDLFHEYPYMAELSDPNHVEAYDIIRRVTVFIPQYEELISFLNKQGYKERTDAVPPSLVPMPYDWRKSNMQSAKVVAKAVDDLYAEWSGNVEIILLAHSMGGLVCRYYLEAKEFKNVPSPGYRAVSTLITLATPHRGSPKALTGILGQDSKIWLNAEQVKELANNEEFPSVYELLPPPSEPFVTEEIPPLRPVDIWNSPDLNLNASNMASAVKLFNTIESQTAQVRYFCFCGTSQNTLVGLTKDSNGELTKLEIDDGGDGTVPVMSSSLPHQQWIPVGGEHSVIYRDTGLQEELAKLVQRHPQIAPPSVKQRIGLYIRDKVLPPGAEAKATLEFPAPRSSITGQLSFTKAKISTKVAGGKIEDFVPYGKPMAISYRGVSLNKLALELKVPPDPGIYRLEFATKPGGRAVVKTELYIKAPQR